MNTVDIYTIYENGWITRIKPPHKRSNAEKLLLLLHGWTGDEHSMWVFTTKLPEDYWFVALRAPIKTQIGGYGWVIPRPGEWSKLSEFKTNVDNVFTHLNYLYRYLGISPDIIDLMGFSQGGAMAYASALLYPRYINKTAVLSGFLPTVDLNITQKYLFQKINFLITHGNLDDIVPVEKAREAADYLRKLGISPEYCEEEVGHKLSATCHRAVQKFFT